MYKIYLDDERTPTKDEWVICRNFDEFINRVEEIGLDKIEIISLDHDLDPTAIAEYFNNVETNYKLNYANITEKTGYDCAVWLVDKSIKTGTTLPIVYTHSANPIGASNIIACINSYLRNMNLPQTCKKNRIPFTFKNI